MDIFRQPIEVSPHKAEKYALVAIALHNYLDQTDTAFCIPSSKDFSHVTKSRIFKNLNLRKKADRSFHFPEKPFQAPKIIFKSPKLIGQKSLSYGHLLKDK